MSSRPGSPLPKHVAASGRRDPPIGRAVGNLFAALRGRAQGGFDTETVHQVAEILDEAARKIERL